MRHPTKHVIINLMGHLGLGAWLLPGPLFQTRLGLAQETLKRASAALISGDKRTAALLSSMVVEMSERLVPDEPNLQKKFQFWMLTKAGKKIFKLAAGWKVHNPLLEFAQRLLKKGDRERAAWISKRAQRLSEELARSEPDPEKRDQHLMLASMAATLITRAMQKGTPPKEKGEPGLIVDPLFPFLTKGWESAKKADVRVRIEPSQIKESFFGFDQHIAAATSILDKVRTMAAAATSLEEIERASKTLNSIVGPLSEARTSAAIFRRWFPAWGDINKTRIKTIMSVEGGAKDLVRSIEKRKLELYSIGERIERKRTELRSIDMDQNLEAALKISQEFMSGKIPASALSLASEKASDAEFQASRVLASPFTTEEQKRRSLEVKKTAMTLLAVIESARQEGLIPAIPPAAGETEPKARLLSREEIKKHLEKEGIEAAATRSMLHYLATKAPAQTIQTWVERFGTTR